MATRGSRWMFLTLRFLGRWPATISSPSSPIQTRVTCGLPSRLSVTKCARQPDSIKFLMSCGIFTADLQIRLFLAVVSLDQPYRDMRRLQSAFDYSLD